MEKINLSFNKGDTFSKGFTIENFPLNITQIYFTIKEKPSDRNFVLQKTLENGIEIDTEKENRYVLTLEADDTNDFKANSQYVYDIELVSDSYKKTIVAGYLTLEDWDITSKANEV